MRRSNRQFSELESRLQRRTGTRMGILFSSNLRDIIDAEFEILLPFHRCGALHGEIVESTGRRRVSSMAVKPVRCLDADETMV
jgi:hypothetical protein